MNERTVSPVDPKNAVARLRLYIARSTPNSTRAQRNLSEALKELHNEKGGPELEIVDVFTNPHRAIHDGIIVTPTLIGLTVNGRMTMMGDLSDTDKLKFLLQALQTEATDDPAATGSATAERLDPMSP